MSVRCSYCCERPAIVIDLGSPACMECALLVPEEPEAEYAFTD